MLIYCANLNDSNGLIMENAFVIPVKSQNLIFHHVQSDDTLSGIIRQYHTDKIIKMPGIMGSHQANLLKTID